MDSWIQVSISVSHEYHEYLVDSRPILKGDGVVLNWLGHANFEIGTLSLSVRRMPAFFETFPVILVDQGGTVRADIPFRRAESRYSVQQTNVVLYFSGGILNATEYSTPSLVKSYARKSQFGKILNLIADSFRMCFTMWSYRYLRSEVCNEW